jgi:SAM-dependent methyltransferase
VAESIDYFSKDHPLRRFATERALRARRRMFERFRSVVATGPATSVLDVGVTPDEELADSNFFERWYPYPERITATSIEDAGFLETRYPGLRFVRTDGASLPFGAAEFDVAFSSAVLEHVGGPDAQRAFIAEICRVSRECYLTTPNRWFPLELHTFIPFVHWLPRRWHRGLLRAIGRGFWADPANLHLVGARELVGLFPPGLTVTLHRHRTAGWCSNLVVHARPEPPAGPGLA